MKPFSKSEIKGLAIIFFILIVVSFPNFNLSLRRARDAVRKNDMGAVLQSLEDYFSDFGFFPPSSDDGRIMACKKPGDVVTKDKDGRLIVNFIPCNWGKDAIADVTQDGGKVHMPLLPRDPDFKKGASYRYISDGKRFQIYTSLEGADEAEYDLKIIARNLVCGNRVCNAARSYADTPTDVSLEEHDKRLLGK